jgi:hypothetical protein
MKAYLLFLAVLIATSFFAMTAMAQEDAAAACPLLSKQCPDGHYVSPRGPDCEMPECLGGDEIRKAPSEEDCDSDDCEDKETDQEND